jgi:hypothetical protein
MNEPHKAAHLERNLLSFTPRAVVDFSDLRALADNSLITMPSIEPKSGPISS